MRLIFETCLLSRLPLWILLTKGVCQFQVHWTPVTQLLYHFQGLLCFACF